MNIENALLTYWFNEDEISIYMFCLKYWHSGATKIARWTWINRATTYSKIKEMIKKGYLIENKINKIKHFSCVMPENLITILEHKQNNIKAVSNDIYSLVWSGLSKTTIEQYEWTQALIWMYQRVFNSDTELKAFLWTTTFNPKISAYVNNMLYPKKISKKIKSKTLISCPNVKLKDLGIDQSKLKERRKSNSISFAKDSIITLYWPNKIAMVNFSETKPTWILIEDEQIFFTLENIFDFLWSLAW